MSFPYKNPLSSSQLTGVNSVPVGKTYGTNFSVLQTGGYMEVFSMSDLGWTTNNATGNIEYSGNTIPIQFSKGFGASPNSLILNSDNISSGRRRLGMLVYVYETQQTYQYNIPNYESLWNSITGLTGTSAITQSSFSTTVNTRSAAGTAFVNSWTGSTVEGVSGVTASNANWRIYRGGGVSITGGTYDSGTTTLNLYTSTGGTISITGFTSGGGGGTTVTGGTFDHNTATLTINSSDNSSVNISGFTDVYTTGGTLSGGTLVLFNSTGGTVNITGFTTLDHISYGETSNLDTGLRVIDTEPTSGVTGVFYDYILTSNDTNYRAGTFTIISDRTNVDWTEVCTLDLGYTDDVVLSADINSGLIRFLGTFPSNDWQLNYVKNTVGSTFVNPPPSATPTPTPTTTPTPTPSTSSTTPTPTPSVTSTQTPTPTVTPTNTETPTSTPTPTITPTSSVTPTVTPTNTVTPTVTPTVTQTPSTTPYIYGCEYVLGYTGSGFTAPPSYTITWNDYYGNPQSHTFTGDNQVPGYTFCAQCGSFNNGGNPDIVISTTNACGSLPTPTPTNTVTPTITPTITSSVTPTETPTNTPTPTKTPTPTPTPASGETGDGWFFYTPEGPIAGPPSANGNTIFIGSSLSTFNPNYTGGTFNLFFNNNTSSGTSYASQFLGLDTTGGTMTISQGSNTVIYSGTSANYTSSASYIQLSVTGLTQMIQSASTVFVSGTTINVITS